MESFGWFIFSSFIFHAFHYLFLLWWRGTATGWTGGLFLPCFNALFWSFVVYYAKILKWYWVCCCFFGLISILIEIMRKSGKCLIYQKEFAFGLDSRNGLQCEWVLSWYFSIKNFILSSGCLNGVDWEYNISLFFTSFNMAHPHACTHTRTLTHRSDDEILLPFYRLFRENWWNFSLKWIRSESSAGILSVGHLVRVVITSMIDYDPIPILRKQAKDATYENRINDHWARASRVFYFIILIFFIFFYFLHFFFCFWCFVQHSFAGHSNSRWKFIVETFLNIIAPSESN